MEVKIEDKVYETGKFSPSVLKRVLEAQKSMENAEQSIESTIKAFDELSNFICLLLISGTEKIAYRNIKLEQIKDLQLIIEDNYTFIDIVNLFTEIMKEISESVPSEGKQIVA